MSTTQWCHSDKFVNKQTNKLSVTGRQVILLKSTLSNKLNNYQNLINPESGLTCQRMNIKQGKIQDSTVSFLIQKVSLQSQDSKSRSQVPSSKMAAEYNTEAEQIAYDNQLEAELQIWAQLNEVRRRIYKAREQICILDRKLQDLYQRYHDADVAMQRRIMYDLRMVTMQSMRTNHYRYVTEKVDEMHELERKLEEIRGEEEDEDDETWEYDSELEEMYESD